MTIKDKNYFCLPKSLNANISHQLFHYKITFVNPQHEKVILNSKTVLSVRFKDICYTKTNLTQI